MALTKISGSILKDPLNLGEVSIGGTLTYQDVTNVDSVGIITAREGIFIPDSKKLHIGNTAGHGDLQLYHDGNSSFIHDTGTGGIYIPASEFTVTNTGITQSGIKFFEGGSVELYEAGSKKIETTSTGAVITGICTATSFSGDGSNLTGIDTDLVSDTSPQLGGDLASNGNDIVMADNDSVKLGASTDFIMFHDSSGHTYLQDQGNGALRIRSDSEVAIQKWDGSTNENMGKFVPDGAVELYHDNSKKLETYSDGVKVTGVLRGTTTGFGIDFGETSNASGMSSEVLDDYEEGTWVPGLAFGATDTGMTYSSRSGSYVKIGRFVYCQGQLDLSSKGSSTGDATFTGLPFTVGDYVTGTSQEGSGFITWWANMSSGSIPTTFWISQGSTSAAIYRALEGSYGGIQTQTHSYWNNNSQVRFLLQYMAA